MAIKLGTAGNDTVTGTAGWDTLYGLLGNDVLFGGTGRDILSGGDGNDTLEGGAGADSLNGGAGADVFKYSKFTDVTGDKIVDFATDDKMDFSAIANAKFIGNSLFNGVAGEMRYFTSGDSMMSRVTTYISVDTNGDAEEDVFLYISSNSFNLMETTSNSFNLMETASNSKILTFAPNQTLTGTNVSGGAGNDTLTGSLSDDNLIGAEGKDVLQGSDGNDLLVGGLGNDTLTGGAGADVFRFDSPNDFSPTNTTSLIGLTGGFYRTDVITDFGVGDKIVFNFQGMTFVGETYSYQRSLPGQYGYSSFGELWFDFDGDKNSDVTISLPANLSSLGLLQETTTATSSTLEIVPNKTVIGTSANETLKGGIANDTVIGNAGNDSLLGFEGNDDLDGGNGADTLVGGLGTDNLTGGAGADIFKYTFLTDLSGYGERITDLTVGDKIDLRAITGLSFIGTDRFTSIANQVKVQQNYWESYLQIDTNGDSNSDYDLYLPNTGTSNKVVIEETTVGSNIFQIAENKVLVGTDLNNILKGGNGYDSLDGGLGNDSLVGGGSNDTLIGGTGNDTLIGGLGGDTLTGGAGADVFKFNSLDELIYSNGNDTITDFTTGDKINLASVDANLLIAGDQSFSLVTSFTGVAGQLQYSNYGIYGDVNGDWNSDFYINLTGSIALTATDLIL